MRLLIGSQDCSPLGSQASRWETGAGAGSFDIQRFHKLCTRFSHWQGIVVPEIQILQETSDSVEIDPHEIWQEEKGKRCGCHEPSRSCRNYLHLADVNPSPKPIGEIPHLHLTSESRILASKQLRVFKKGTTQGAKKVCARKIQGNVAYTILQADCACPVQFFSQGCILCSSDKQFWLLSLLQSECSVDVESKIQGNRGIIRGYGMTEADSINQ